MKTVYDLSKARETVARQLSRRDIGNNHLIRLVRPYDAAAPERQDVGAGGARRSRRPLVQQHLGANRPRHRPQRRQA